MANLSVIIWNLRLHIESGKDQNYYKLSICPKMISVNLSDCIILCY